MNVFNQFPGVYGGIVEENRDPEKLGRLKVRVLAIFGTPGEVGVDSLPWALPRGMPAGNSPQSGGLDLLPEVKDHVWVSFLDGEPEKPLWEWANQTRSGAKSLPLYDYDPVSKRPRRAAITRYGHTVELNSKTILLNTKRGNSILVDDDADGAIVMVNQGLLMNAEVVTTMADNLETDITRDLRLKAGENLTLLAKNKATETTEDVIENIGKSYTMFVNSDIGTSIIRLQKGAISLTAATGASWSIDNEGNISFASPDGTNVSVSDGKIQVAMPNDGASAIIEPTQVTVNAQNVIINGQSIALGQEATDSPVLAEKLMLLFNAHTHTNGNLGSPTGPPILPIVDKIEVAAESTLIQ